MPVLGPVRRRRAGVVPRPHRRATAASSARCACRAGARPRAWCPSSGLVPVGGPARLAELVPILGPSRRRGGELARRAATRVVGPPRRAGARPRAWCACRAGARPRLGAPAEPVPTSSGRCASAAPARLAELVPSSVRCGGEPVRRAGARVLTATGICPLAAIGNCPEAAKTIT